MTLYNFVNEKVVGFDLKRSDATFKVVIVKQMFIPFFYGRVALSDQASFG